MPPRKSTALTTPATPAPQNNTAGDTSILSTTTIATTEPKSPTVRKTNRPSTGGEGENEKVEKKKSKNDDTGIDDLLLPRTLTSRLSRGTLPPNTSIQRDALLALTKSATVFISYLGHTANGLTSRKTIQAGDILEALRETGLWDVRVGGPSDRTLGERVQAEVEKWEDEVRGKRKGYRDRVRARESGGGTTAAELNDDSLLGPAGTGTREGETDEDDGRGPLAKRARRSSAADTDATMDVDGDAAAAAQLRGETVAADRDDQSGGGGADDVTEADPDIDADEEEQDEEADVDVEEEDEEPEQDEEEEDDDDEDDENQDDDDGEDDEARRDRLDDDPRRHTTLAPNGRVEVGSDEESD